MSSTSYKSNELAAELASELKLRLATLTQVTGFDSNGNPTIAIGDGVAGHANVFILIKPIDWALAKDIFGNSANQYTPHTIQIATEANPAGGAGADCLTRSQLANFLVPITKKGTRFEWFERANGAAPLVTDLVAANLKVTIENDLYWNVQSSS